MAPRRITGKAGDPVQLLAPRHKGEKENNMFETYYNESVKYDAILKNGKTVIKAGQYRNRKTYCRNCS